MIKKIISVITVLAVSTFCFAENYFNITLGYELQAMYQDCREDSYNGLNVQLMEMAKATVEWFHTFEENSFGLGVKGGFCTGSTSFCDVEDHKIEDSKVLGFSFAPSLGWAWGEGTKKKINLYPVTFEHVMLTEGRSSVDNNVDLTLDETKFGATFSWQWGQGIIQNGFQIGFDLAYKSILEYEGHKIGKSGRGVDFNLAYKLSYLPYK